MKLYKPEFKDKRTGENCKCKHWYLTFIDNRQIRRRLPLFSDKRASQRAEQKIEDLLNCNGNLSTDLQKWIESLPDKPRSKLIEWQLIESQRLSANLGKVLAEHLSDFLGGLGADGNKAYYVEQTQRAITSILEGCHFKFWSDLDGNKVKTFLAKGRGSTGYGERSYNSRLQAFKSFTSWLLEEERVAGRDPMKGHNLIKQTEFRKKRRALTFKEMHHLLKTTEAAPIRFNMSGHERALIYRLALQTGLRAGELKSLRKLSFDFAAKPANVHVEPSDAKGKRPADLVLMDDTAKALEEHLSGKDLADPAFNMVHNTNAANMLKADLKIAGIVYRDEAGRDLDFHSLRHSFITHLALAGVHPSVAQQLARHSSITLTMKYYTHVLRPSEVQAIDSLQKITTNHKPDDGYGDAKNLSVA